MKKTNYVHVIVLAAVLIVIVFVFFFNGTGRPGDTSGDTAPVIATLLPYTAEWRLPTPEEVSAVGTVEGIAAYDYRTFSTALFDEELVRYWNPDWLGMDNLSYRFLQPDRGLEAFSLTGVGNLDLFDVQTGQIRLVEGTGLGEGPANGVVVSKQFAQANDLGLGSYLEVRQIFNTRFAELAAIETEDYYHQFVIAGIFELNEPDHETDLEQLAHEITQADVLNRIYGSMALVQAINEIERDWIHEHISPEFETLHLNNSIWIATFLLAPGADGDEVLARASSLAPEGMRLELIE